MQAVARQPNTITPGGFDRTMVVMPRSNIIKASGYLGDMAGQQQNTATSYNMATILKTYPTTTDASNT
jgi:hypothetical protein